MRDLERALADITAIRSQMARGTEFRGYGPVTMATTGFLTMLGAAVQALFTPDPQAATGTYLILWLGVAALSAALIGSEMIARARRMHSGFADEMLQTAVEQFMPAGVAGALLTLVLWRYAPQSLWMMPGLWQLVFSLGVFASCRSLPRPIFAAGVWYLATSLATLAFANGAHAFSPWAMALPFGLGQLYIAVVLYRSSGAADGA